VRKSLPNHHDIRQLQNIRLLTAKLRMYAIDEGGGGTFFVLPNANEWSEDALTWSSQDDELDRTGELQVGSVDWVDAFKWAEIDVTGAFNNYHFDSGNDLTFLFKPGSMNGVTFASRERNSGALSPELVLTFSATTPAPTSWPTYLPTRSPTRSTTNPTTMKSELPTSRPTESPVLQVKAFDLLVRQPSGV